MRPVSRIARGALVLRTIRHLKPVQLVFYPLRRLQQKLPPPRLPPAEEVTASALASLAEEVLRWGPGNEAVRLAQADEIVAGRFEFLNHREEFTHLDWDRPFASPLWTFHLHYFDYAVDLAWAARLTGDKGFAARFTELLTSWIRQTRSRRGPGWEPYVISVRTINWTLALLILGDRVSEADRQLIHVSLFEQLSHLEQRLEHHIQANHLQRNVTALLVGGLLFDGPHATRWRNEFGPAMWKGLEEQVLPDGGHYERSPMYHTMALVDFAQAVALCDAVGEAVPAPARRRVDKMLGANAILRRPDGTFHLFNDCGADLAAWNPHLDELVAKLWEPLPPEPTGNMSLSSMGYFGHFAPRQGERILVGCAPPAPGYQPGHAHCDLLSFELDVGGRPVVVDSGTSGYDGNPLRHYERSTAAHNTVTIDEKEQSEFWGTFRVARRARVITAGACLDGNTWTFHGAYAPYHAPSAIHDRTIQRREGTWTVTDRVSGCPGSTLASYLHLHPDFVIVERNGQLFAEHDATSFEIEPFGFDETTILRGADTEPGSWHSPAYGRVYDAPTVAFRIQSHDGEPFGYRIKARS